MHRSAFNVACIIPTGIGASIGGFGGDAMPVLTLLSEICDTLITHPNVANAACFQALPSNALYVEGYALDQFFRGIWALKPVRHQKIGVIWDSGASNTMETLHRNTIAAVQTVYGVHVVDIIKTAEPVRIQLSQGASGRSTGCILNPEILLDAGQTLINRGATALAVCCIMPEAADAEDNLVYQAGKGVDPIGGIEAMISHLLVSHFNIPAAHAPIFADEDAQPVTDRLVDPRAASEFIVSTFLPCVLTGLSHAPHWTTLPTQQQILTLSNLSALVVPSDALGSLPVLACLENDIPVLAVGNNTSVMACSGRDLGFEDNVIPVENYLEAAGWLIIHRARLSPQVARRLVHKP